MARRVRKPDPIDALDPSLAAWFSARYPALSPIQKLALPHTLAGESTLILAPTGSGKTLSAFLSILSDLAVRARQGKLANAVHAVYVSPLRSLDRDIHRNLTSPLEAINAGLPFDQRLRMEVRTGDTESTDRGRQARSRPHLLLTTPESLNALLSQSMWRDGFSPTAVVVDEIHSFAESKRGTLLALTMERLELRAPSGHLQRIGLSATARPVDAVVQLLCGSRPCAVVESEYKRSYSLDVAVPQGRLLPAAGWNPFRIAHPVADLVSASACSLIFTTTRSGAERLGLALKVLLPDFEDWIAVHHGSIDRETREHIEGGLATGLWKAVVASSSLELGVDFSSVDQVILIGAPRGVSRTLQRLGRSGHRVDGVANGKLAPLSLPDLVECIALTRAVELGKLDEIHVPLGPLDVLAQALLGMSIERAWKLEEAYAMVRRSGPYQNLDYDSFLTVIEYLAGGGRVLGPYGTYGKIEVLDGTMRVASRQVARQYYMNIGTISDDFAVTVVTRTNRRLGSVEEGFLAGLRPEEAFLMGGKPVVIERMQGNLAVVKPASGERVQTPRWMGQKMPLTAQLAAEELRLRRAMRQAMASGGLDAVRLVLEREYRMPADVADQVLHLLIRQHKAAPLPVDDPVQVERTVDGRSVVLQFHVLAGRAVNRSLAWLLSYRLFGDASVVANFDDHCFLLSVGPKQEPTVEQMREAFRPDGVRRDLEHVVATTDTLGRGFRRVAEIGQLLPRRTLQGPVKAKSASWNGSLLYKTLLEHEPDHPLVRETLREVIEDQMDCEQAEKEAARIYTTEWEYFRHPRPSPFGLPLFAAFNRETLLAQDPEKALDELVESLFDQWESEPTVVASAP